MKYFLPFRLNSPSRQWFVIKSYFFLTQSSAAYDYKIINFSSMTFVASQLRRTLMMMMVTAGVFCLQEREENFKLLKCLLFSWRARASHYFLLLFLPFPPLLHILLVEHWKGFILTSVKCFSLLNCLPTKKRRKSSSSPWKLGLMTSEQVAVGGTQLRIWGGGEKGIFNINYLT